MLIACGNQTCSKLASSSKYQLLYSIPLQYLTKILNQLFYLSLIYFIFIIYIALSEYNTILVLLLIIITIFIEHCKRWVFSHWFLKTIRRITKILHFFKHLYNFVFLVRIFIQLLNYLFNLLLLLLIPQKIFLSNNIKYLLMNYLI
jgi:hypothetical protein